MTTTALSPEPHRTAMTSMRIINVMRLHFANKFQLVMTPWLIMGFIFGVSLLIGWIARGAGDPTTGEEGFTIEINGSVFYFLVYMLVLAVMAISQMFPFSQSYSVTRREFYVGTVLTFLGLSIAYSLVITLLGAIEDASGGWGLNVSVFNPGIFGPNLAERFYIMVVLFAFFFMTGMATASVYVRWKANGMYIFFGLLVLLIVGLAWLTTATGSWGAVGNWFAAMGLLGVVTWTLVPTFLALVTGYILLRKATPRN